MKQHTLERRRDQLFSPFYVITTFMLSTWRAGPFLACWSANHAANASCIGGKRK